MKRLTLYMPPFVCAALVPVAQSFLATSATLITIGFTIHSIWISRKLAASNLAADKAVQEHEQLETCVKCLTTVPNVTECKRPPPERPDNCPKRKMKI